MIAAVARDAGAVAPWSPFDARRRSDMRLAKLTAQGFRNLEGEVPLPDSMTLIAGENNTGKSNVIDALRLLTQPGAGMRFSRWITSDDFVHDGHGNRVGDTFELEALYIGLTEHQRGRLVTCLAPSVAENAAKIRLAAQLGDNGRVNITWYGGDSLQPGIEPWARETVMHTYLPPLRDAAGDLRPGRDNKLVNLLSALAPEGSEHRTEIETVARDANTSLSGTAAVSEARSEIQSRLDKVLGPLFAQQTGLRFSDPRFDRVIGALWALAGNEEALELGENGLGFNNLLYMATLLAALTTDPPEDGLHLLLVEEPEAHLHPQLQDLLMRYLEGEAGAKTQVVVTTHSPNFAAASGVERMTVMTRTAVGQPIVARSPATFGLEQKALDHLRRFLDVTKASLLFARGVILVEGIAEQLLLPQLADRSGVSLSEAGITIVNVGGVSFAPFAELFSSERLPYRCAVVSDGDPPQKSELDDELEGGEPLLSATAQKLKANETDTLRVFLAARTFEWDLANAGNWQTLIAALALVKPKVAQGLAGLENGRPDALLGAVTDVKGRFAQALTEVIADGRDFTVPQYLQDAISWASGS
jgi:putative ATP-dependent endonuclease of OLD family